MKVYGKTLKSQHGVLCVVIIEEIFQYDENYPLLEFFPRHLVNLEYTTDSAKNTIIIYKRPTGAKQYELSFKPEFITTAEGSCLLVEWHIYIKDQFSEEEIAKRFFLLQFKQPKVVGELHTGNMPLFSIQSKNKYVTEWQPTPSGRE